jgi:murein DD-endopeptidase MepM/ murein hydrolase activator NlpD
VTRRRLTAVLLVAALAAVAIPTEASAAYRYGARVMKMGCKGKDVSKLQRNLTTLGYPTAADGVFGPTTKKNVKKLERNRGWKLDGRVSKKDAVRISKLVAKRKTKPSKVFYLNGITKPSLTVTAAAAGDATVEVSEVASGEAVATLPVSFPSPGSQTVSWNGINSAGAGAPEGSYRMSVADPGTAEAAGVQAKSFGFYWHAFPVPGTHNYGGKGSRFGADRGDHSHQGQDMAAACGEPLRVATGGVVTTKAYQAGGAGYYIVIKGSATGESYVYMHMIKASWAAEGQTVYTDQQIGKVGNTGSSSGCHLHFELWTAPGWYEGGSPYDPLLKLQAWDAYS